MQQQESTFAIAQIVSTARAHARSRSKSGTSTAAQHITLMNHKPLHYLSFRSDSCQQLLALLANDAACLLASIDCTAPCLRTYDMYMYMATSTSNSVVDDAVCMPEHLTGCH